MKRRFNAMTLIDIANCFNGDRYLSADQIAARLGRKPDKTWQQNLAVVLADHSIVPGRSYVNGKRRRVYWFRYPDPLTRF
jgi:hypothetical protein